MFIFEFHIPLTFPFVDQTRQSVLKKYANEAQPQPTTISWELTCLEFPKGRTKKIGLDYFFFQSFNERNVGKDHVHDVKGGSVCATKTFVDINHCPEFLWSIKHAWHPCSLLNIADWRECTANTCLVLYHEKIQGHSFIKVNLILRKSLGPVFLQQEL